MTNRVPARLNRLNHTGVFLVTAVVVFAALAIGGWLAAAALLLLGAALVALLVVTWSGLTPRGRTVRLAVLGLLVMLAVLAAGH